MSPVFVVAVLAVGCRVLGIVGVVEVSSWLQAARWATGLTFVIMGSAHLTPMRHDIVRLVPPWVPRPDVVVTALGIWQIVGGIGLLVTPARGIAAVGLILLLILKFPVNVRVARQSLRLNGRLATSPTWRIPSQFVWIALVWWVGT